MSQPMPFETADKNDDDGQVIDSFFIETDNPPPIKDAIEPIVVRALPDTAPITRMISKDQNLDPTWQGPTQLLPADAKRKSLSLYVYSPTAVATDGVRFSDDNGASWFGGKVLHNGNITLDHHTGPLWVMDAGAVAGRASATVSVQMWAVTQ